MTPTAARPRFTLDTNLLVYSVDLDAGPRHIAAAQIVRCAVSRDCWLTLQAVSEFYAAVTRKGYAAPAEAAAAAGDWLHAFPCVAVSASAIRAALADAVAGRASYWDALLVATAAEAGCRLILTEDLADGATLGGVAIHNPFADGGGLTERARRLLAPYLKRHPDPGLPALSSDRSRASSIDRAARSPTSPHASR
jgi:predicted nucleic acid-binding protein